MIFFVKNIHLSDIYNKKCTTVYKLMDEHVIANSPCTCKRIAFPPTAIPQ